MHEKMNGELSKNKNFWDLVKENLMLLNPFISI